MKQPRYDQARVRWMLLDRLGEVILRVHKQIGCLVEIGMGGSTLVLGDLARRFKRPLISCDIREDMTKGYKQKYFHTTFAGTSFDFIAEFDDLSKGNPPVLVFMDGSHDYEIVKREVSFFLSLLVPHGVLFVHDTLPPTDKHVTRDACGDVYRLRQELEQQREEIDCFTFPFTAQGCGLTMVLKKEAERPYYRK